jgi:hypothetical protein
MTPAIEKASRAITALCEEYSDTGDTLAAIAVLETLLEPSDEEIEAVVSLGHWEMYEVRAALRAAALARLGRKE